MHEGGEVERERGSTKMQWLDKEVVEALRETAEVLKRRKDRKKVLEDV